MKPRMTVLAAAALAACLSLTPAQAQRGLGAGIAAGVIGGAIVGGAIASSPYPYGYYGPGYGYYDPGYVGGPYGTCYLQRQRFWDGYGWRVRSVRVCN